MEHSLVPRAGRPGCCAQRFCWRLFLFFLASLVLQEQLLHDPTHPYTCPPPALLPPSARGFPGEEQEERGWEGELPESHWFPHLSTWQLVETRRVVSLGEAALSRRSPKDSRPALGNGAGAGLLEI